MSRPLRLEFAGALYHITARGNRREAIYETDDDRRDFLNLLGDVNDSHNWLVHAYCLMTNHYHLLVETPEANLSHGMRQINGTYSQRFNRRHRRVGHVFQGRYKAILVQKESYLLELSRYIVLNPVRARMVPSAGDWRWSSYRAVLGVDDPIPGLMVDKLLSLFGRQRAEALESYRQFVAAGVGQNSPLENLKSQIYLGDNGFVAAMQQQLGVEDSLLEVPRVQRRPLPQPLAEYAAQYDDRNQAILAAYQSGGYTLKAIGDHFGLHYSRVSRIISRAKGRA